MIINSLINLINKDSFLIQLQNLILGRKAKSEDRYFNILKVEY